MKFDGTLKRAGVGALLLSFLYDPAFTVAPILACVPVPACLPHQMCQRESRACPPNPAPPPQGLALSSFSGKGAEWTLHLWVKEPGVG